MIASSSNGGPPALELRDVRRRFGDTRALSGLSMSVREGQLVGFVGPNGAGKTTALRIVLGVLSPDEGQVLWRDRPIDPVVRRRFGYMPEERGLYQKMRVGDQLEFFAHLHGLGEREGRDAASRWTSRLNLEQHADARVESLSLGNQQRVQLATALVHDPELLVLDEPFSGLDPQGVDSVSRVLRERARAGVAVVVSSHQLDLVERLCDAVMILDEGQIVRVIRPDADGAGEERHISLHLAGSRSSWWHQMEGVELVEMSSSETSREPIHRVRLRIGSSVDDQAVLRAASSAGRVLHFGVDEPSLTELFRETTRN